MKAPRLLDSKERPSAQLHRRQFWTQILLPVLAAAILFFAAIVITSVSAFRLNGDVSRWAAISTMWLLLPVMAAGLLLLAILVALIYLLIYLPPLIPRYTYQAQRLTYRVEAIAKRIAEIARKPLLLVQELSSLIKSYLANR